MRGDRSFRRGVLVGAASVALAAAEAVPSERNDDLLTLANGAIVARATVNPTRALDLQNGNRKDQGWNNERPKDRPPYEFVFELLAPTTLREVGAATSGKRAGGPGSSAKTVDVAASTTGPDADFVALGTLEVPEEGAASLRLAEPHKARWLRFTVRANHGNPSWTYLAEVFATGEQEPVPDDDGRYTGVWESNFGPIELVQTGTEVAGCYRGGTLVGSVSGGVARVGWQDGTSPKVNGTALFVVDARRHLEGVQYRLPGRARWGGPPATAKTPKTECAKKPPPANPIGAAIAARGEVEIYGIHFDFDADVLQPRSETVLRQLAEALGGDCDRGRGDRGPYRRRRGRRLQLGPLAPPRRGRGRLARRTRDRARAAPSRRPRRNRARRRQRHRRRPGLEPSSHGRPATRLRHEEIDR